MQTEFLPRRSFLASGVCAAMLAGTSPFVARGTEPAAKLTDLLRSRMNPFITEPSPQQVAGLVAVIGGPTGALATVSLGWRDIDSRAPMETDSLFRIASMTKPVTAMGILILQDEKKLSVDDPVAKHLPEFAGQKIVKSRMGDALTLGKPSRPITLRDLLTHTSGLPGGYPEGVRDLYSTRRLSLAEATYVISQCPLEFEPGTKWAYCNSGIDTLGRVIEVVSGKSYIEFLTSRIFEPLKMRDTTPFPTAAQLQRLATLYRIQNGRLEGAGFELLGPTANAKHPIPAGGLYSTASDIATLYQMTLNGGQLGGSRVLSEDAVKQMTSLQTGELECGFTPGMGFGFGFAFVRKPQGVHAMMSAGTFGHGGAFGTQGWIDPVHKRFVILLIQRSGMPNADASELRKTLQTVAIEATN